MFIKPKGHYTSQSMNLTRISVLTTRLDIPENHCMTSPTLKLLERCSNVFDLNA